MSSSTRRLGPSFPRLAVALAFPLVLITFAPARAGLNAQATAHLYWQVGTGAGLPGRDSQDSVAQFVVTVTGMQSFRGADVQLYVVGLSGMVPPAWQAQDSGCAGMAAVFQEGGFGGAYPSAFASVPGVATAQNRMYYQAQSYPCLTSDNRAVIWLEAAGAAGAPMNPAQEYAILAFQLDLTGRLGQGGSFCEGDLADPRGPLNVDIIPWHHFPCGDLPPGSELLVVDANNELDVIPFDAAAATLRWGPPLPGESHGWYPDGNALSGGQFEKGVPAVISDGAGGALLSWPDHYHGPNVRGQHINPGARIVDGWYVRGNLVSGSGGSPSSPLMCSDSAGGAFVTWSDARGGAERKVYAQRIQGSGGLPTGWVADGNALCGADGAQEAAGIVADGLGGAYVAWVDHRGGAAGAMYVQRLTGAGAPAQGWPAWGISTCASEADQALPNVAADGFGGVILAWQDGRAGDRRDVYVQRMTGAGALAAGWPAAGVLVSSSTADKRTALLAPDGAGGAFVFWQEARSSRDIYVQRITAGGAIASGWPAEGSAVCAAPADQHLCAATADGQGGAIAAWWDARGGFGLDLYCQRVNQAGGVVPGWPDEGAAVAPCHNPLNMVADSASRTASMTPDGAGGALLAWQDGRNGNFDIYAQRMAASGAPAAGWAGGGILAGGAGGDQVSPSIAGDGAGGAYVAWADFRAGAPGDYSDPYLQRVTSEGLTGTAIAVPPHRANPVFRLLASWPNPTRAGATLAFELASVSKVRVEVFDITGRLVRTLASGEAFPAGAHMLDWDGWSASGRRVASGVYFLKVEAAGRAERAKIVVLR